jgi:hypothetical protein
MEMAREMVKVILTAGVALISFSSLGSYTQHW